MDIKLKIAILQSGLSQRDLSRSTGINESIISMAVRGKYNLDQEQRSRIARALGKPEHQVFQETGYQR
jgi:ribosome-binding protein aMBF1 (putative translation factor)